MPIPDYPPPPPGGKLVVEQEPAISFSGKIETNYLPSGRLLSNLSGIDPVLRKNQAWPQNWWPIALGYTEEKSANDSSITITYQGPWGERFYFQTYLLGFALNAGNNDPKQTTGNLLREIPHQFFAEPWMYCAATKVLEPFGAWIQDYNYKNLDGSLLQSAISFVDSSTGSDYESCRVQAVYRRPRYEVRTDDEVYNNQLNEMSRFLERVPGGWAFDALPVPQNLLKWVNGPQAGVNVPQGSLRLVLPSKEITYVWHLVPDINEAAFLACHNHVNSVAFDPPYVINGLSIGGVYLGKDSQGKPINGYPAGTVLMHVPPRPERRDMPNGHVNFDLMCKFLVRMIPNPNYNPQGPADPTNPQWWGWNHFPINPNAFYYATGDGPGGSGGTVQGSPLYASADLNSVFTVPNPPIVYQGAGTQGIG